MKFILFASLSFHLFAMTAIVHGLIIPEKVTLVKRENDISFDIPNTDLLHERPDIPSPVIDPPMVNPPTVNPPTAYPPVTPLCPLKSDRHPMIPVPHTKCSQYYSCDGALAKIHTCGDGLQFSTLQQKCVSDFWVICTD